MGGGKVEELVFYIGCVWRSLRKGPIGQRRPDVLDGNYKQYTREMVEFAESKGVTVWPDAQSPFEDTKTWDDALARGLKGIQSDHPAALISYLKEKGLR